MVVFGDAEDGPTDYVLLQLASEFDDQDRETGMDGIYLEINDQAHSGYKLVQRIEVKRNVVTLHFSPRQLGLSEAYSPFCILHSGTASMDSDVRKTLANMANRAGIEFVHKLAQ